MTPLLRGRRRRRRPLPRGLACVEVAAAFDTTFANGLPASLTENQLSAVDEQAGVAWPYFATETDLAGLPPHVVSVNELDPLRDEGIAYFRKLQRAGVSAVGRVNLGLVHAAEMTFRQAVVDAYRATVRDIHGFAASL